MQQVPGPFPSGVHAACSERSGGVSAAPYDTLNLGDHVGDSPGAVAENRRRFAGSLDARPVFLRQVHGTSVVRLQAGTPDGVEADACWTSERGVACTIMVADCLPVLFASADGERVGAAHCGWRGLAGEGGRGTIETLAEAMALGTEAGAWLGPCIGPDRFEVGPEVRDAFVREDAGAATFFRAAGGGKFLADLPALARRRLQALGIAQVSGNDGSPAWCTVTNRSRFFSHRRDRVSGRSAASIWLA